MTIYEMMTNLIESYTRIAIKFEKENGTPCEGVRGMIDGATQARENLTIEAAQCEC